VREHLDLLARALVQLQPRRGNGMRQQRVSATRARALS
jgi:hypothetical protein